MFYKSLICMGALIKNLKHRFAVRECFVGTNMGWGLGVDIDNQILKSFYSLRLSHLK